MFQKLLFFETKFYLEEKKFMKFSEFYKNMIYLIFIFICFIFIKIIQKLKNSDFVNLINKFA